MFVDEEINAALVRELCSGRKFIESLEKRREIEAAAEAKKMREVKSIAGKPVGSIPQRERRYSHKNTEANAGMTEDLSVTFSNHNHTLKQETFNADKNLR